LAPHRRPPDKKGARVRFQMRPSTLEMCCNRTAHCASYIQNWETALQVANWLTISKDLEILELLFQNFDAMLNLSRQTAGEYALCGATDRTT